MASIKYPIRSRFVEALRQGIKLGRSRLEQGRLIEIKLEPGGYQGKCSLIIRPDDEDEFEVVGTLKDPSRFAQRIRVAAWALLQEGAYGRFAVEHDRESGIVMIKSRRLTTLAFHAIRCGGACCVADCFTQPRDRLLSAAAPDGACQR